MKTIKRLVLLLAFASLASAQLAHIGRGCSTAYFIDNDCDGYGVAVRADGVYTVATNTGDMPDADDDDPAVNTPASVIARWGSISAFLTHKGYPSTRIWYVSSLTPGAGITAGDDTACATSGNFTTSPGDQAAHPCNTTGPFRIVAYCDGTSSCTSRSPGSGGTILFRGGTYSSYGINGGSPSYYPTAASSSSPIVLMNYPGEVATISRAGSQYATNNAASWPFFTGIQNVILDGFAFVSNGTGACINQNDTLNHTFRNMEIANCSDGVEENDHIEYLTFEKNVFHDNTSHAFYPGYSSPIAVPHPLGVDLVNTTPTDDTFFTVTDPANYTAGTSKGVDHDMVFQFNLSYRDGGAGSINPLHFNAYINRLTVQGNIVNSGGIGTTTSGPAAMTLDTGVYNALVQNNLFFNNGGCSIVANLYNSDVQAATEKWNKIINNTFYIGYRDGNPGCAISLIDNTTNTGTVTVSTGSQSVLNIDQTVGPFSTSWAAGTPITLGGVTYHVASATDYTHLTIQEVGGYAGTSGNVTYVVTPNVNDHSFKNFTIANNILVNANAGTTTTILTGEAALRPLLDFGRSSNPATHTVTNNIISNSVQTFSAIDVELSIYDNATPGGHTADGSTNYTHNGQSAWAYTASQLQTMYGASNQIGIPAFVSALSSYDPSPGSCATGCGSNTPGLFDFRLLSTSPAINAGTSTGAPTTDMKQFPRVSSPDAGAYEGPIVTVAKIVPGGTTCSTNYALGLPGFESWNYGSMKYSSDLSKVIVPMRSCIGATQSIYANGWWAVDSSAGSSTPFVHVADFNTGGVNHECQPDTGATPPYARHNYAAASATGGSIYFGFGSCGGAGISDLNALSVGGATITSKTASPAGAFQEGAFASDGSKIMAFGGEIISNATNGTLVYDPANDSAGFVTQHGITCTGTGCVSGSGANPCAAGDSCPPQTRSHTIDYDSVNGVYVFYGGVVGGTVSNQTWAYNAATKAWARKADSPAPATFRPLWAFNPDIRQFVLYTGSTSGTPGTVYTYDYAADLWTTWNSTIPGPSMVYPFTSPDGVEGAMGYDASAKKAVLLNAKSGSGSGTATPEVWTVVFPSVSPPGCTISPSVLGPYTNTQVISQTMTATNCGAGTLTWTSSALLTGSSGCNSVTGTTCVISGTLSAAATFTPTISVSDGGSNTASITPSVIVNAVPAITTSSPLAAGQATVSYSPVTLAASGGTAPLTWTVSAGALPTSMSLSSAGVLSGTPTVACSPCTFTAKATDANAIFGTKSFNITIAPSLPAGPILGRGIIVH